MATNTGNTACVGCCRDLRACAACHNSGRLPMHQNQSRNKEAVESGWLAAGRSLPLYAGMCMVVWHWGSPRALAGLSLSAETEEPPLNDIVVARLLEGMGSASEQPGSVVEGSKTMNSTTFCLSHKKSCHASMPRPFRELKVSLECPCVLLSGGPKRGTRATSGWCEIIIQKLLGDIAQCRLVELIFLICFKTDLRMCLMFPQNDKMNVL